VKRRTKWIISLSVGVPVVIVGGLLLVLILSSPPPRTELGEIETRALPGLSDTVPSGSPAQPELNEEIVSAVLPPTLSTLGLPIRGTLVMHGDGKPFGEEHYELAYEDGIASLRSDGRFWFKALIATINLVFDQTLRWDDTLRPLEYAATFDAPLGFGRSYQASFAEAAAQVRINNDSDTFALKRDHTFIVGTFSTYAVVPLIDALRPLQEAETFDTLMFGGPPSQSREDESDGLPAMHVRRVEDGVIRAGEQEIWVSRYEISSEMGSMFLYALGIEFLGLYAGEEGDALFVYRADFFPDGFEIVDPDEAFR